MEDDALTMSTQVDADQKTPVQTPAGRVCPRCGLNLPLSVAACPKDGTLIDDTLGEGRKLVGNYEFLEFIGSGGMGVIYKAKNPVLKRLVAIKMLHSHLMSDVITRRFQQEAAAVSGLSHRCIIAVHDFGVSEHGQPYMVMDFVDGKPLSEILRKSPLSVEPAINIAIQLAHALQHAHERGVLHRDLKPSNIMVTDYDCAFPEVKIVDFGIAKILESDSTKVTQTGELLGTPQYMSPEQCQGGQLDARSDIYSLGCVIFEAITGKPPFAGATMVSVIVDQISKPARTLAEVRPDMKFAQPLEDLMARALAKDPADRYQSMAAMLEDLNKVQALVGSPEKLDAKGSRQMKWNKEQRQLVLISLAAGFSLLGVGASSIMLTNMIGKAMAGRDLRKEEDRSDRLDKLLALERTKTVRYLDPKRMDDKFFNQYFNTDLGITALDMSGSQITDRSMSRLPAQKSLHFLALDGTHISDEGIANLRALPDLLELHVDRTGLTDRGMKYIGEMKSLKNLSVRGNHISDSGIAAISGLELRSLFFSGTGVTDEALKTVGAMKQMQRLTFGMCPRITGQGIKFLEALPGLQYIDASYNSLSPEGMAALGRLPHLIVLEFAYTGVTTSDIKALSQMPSLEYLSLNGSKVQAAWMPLLGKLPRLKSLSLNDCQIDAQTLALIPKHLPGLTQLQFRFSKLTDKNVEPLSQMQQLQFLDMQGSGVSRFAAESLQARISRPGHDVQIRN